MGYLLATLFLYLSFYGTTHCQKPFRHLSHHRGDIRDEPDTPDEQTTPYFKAEASNETPKPQLQEEVLPYGKDHSAKSSTQDRNCSCSQEMIALQEDIKAETNERLALKATVDNFVSEMQNLQRMVYTSNSSKLVAAPNAIASAEKGFVAFSAKLSYNRELKPLDTVIFDTVLTNSGNPYNTDTGRFTAPLAGTYMFQTTILSGYNTKVETAIIVNDKEVARIYSGAHDAHGSGSNMAIVDLRNGDTVWIRLLYQGGSHVHGYYSTFSGALLHETI